MLVGLFESETSSCSNLVSRSVWWTVLHMDPGWDQHTIYKSSGSEFSFMVMKGKCDVSTGCVKCTI